MNVPPRFSMIARRLRGSQAQTLAEAMVATAIGAFILIGVMTTYITSVKGFTAIANYREIHAGGRLAVTYFAKDMRGVSGVTSFPNSSNITVTVPTVFNTSGSVTSSKSVSYT